jgi:hypothetical protein
MTVLSAYVIFSKGKVKVKVLPLQAVEALTVAGGWGSHIFIDGGKVVSPTCRPLFTPRKIPGTHFY